MGKGEIYLYFGNNCSLRSQSCLKHSAKRAQRSRSKNDLSDFKVKTCFSQKQLGDLVPKDIRKLKGECE